MEKEFIITIHPSGNAEIKCPHCKKTIFEGFYLGITMYDLEGKCPYCKKGIIEKWKEEIKR